MNATPQIPDNVSAQESIPQTLPAGERDRQGRFTEGNAGGPGNPFARQVGILRKVLLNCVDEEDMAAIGSKLVDLAKNGNVQAIKLLFSYTLGKPVEGIHPDQLDMQEWELFRQLAQIPFEADKVAMVPDQSVALKTARVMRPVLAQAMSQDLLQDAASDREQAIRQEERRQQQKILREQRKAQRQASAGKTEPGNGHSNPPPSNGETAPSANGNLSGVKEDSPSANGKTPPDGNASRKTAPSANGNMEGEQNGSPSANGNLNSKSEGSPSANGFSSLLNLLTGRKGPSDNGQDGKHAR